MHCIPLPLSLQSTRLLVLTATWSDARWRIEALVTARQRCLAAVASPPHWRRCHSSASLTSSVIDVEWSTFKNAPLLPPLHRQQPPPHSTSSTSAPHLTSPLFHLTSAMNKPPGR